MNTLKKIAALAAAALMLLPLAACGGRKARVGPALAHNAARFHTPADRTSRFMIDGVPVPGEVKGRAYMETSARGDTSLAWVDTALYFVSAAGVDSLGTGIGTAEISFDGRKALFLEGNELKLYSADTRQTSVIDGGISSVVQFAVSPGGERIAFTACYEEAEDDPRTKLYGNGQLTELLTGRDATVLAVSDDANILWYFEFESGELCVESGGERIVVSNACGADANYNFTNDLSEVAFNTADGVNHLWRLASRTETTLGEGFDYTLKTDVFSISTVTLFTYINDVPTFTNGLWQKRVRTDGGYEYGVGLIDENGGIKWLAENASQALAAPDGSRTAWVAGGRLYSTDLEGVNTTLASDVDRIAFAADPDELYFISGDVLCFVRGENRPERIGSGVTGFETFGEYCVYITNDGSLFCAKGARAEQIGSGFVRMEKRAGHMLAYADPVTEDGDTLYTAYISTDGRSFTPVGKGIKP